MTNPTKSIAKAIDAERLTVNRLDDGTAVLLDKDGEELMSLNEAGRRLIDWIDEGADTLPDLVDRMMDFYEVERDVAHDDAKGFVEEVAELLKAQ